MNIIQADWLKKPGVEKITRLLSDAGFEIYFVGGCVRNSLLNRPVDDIDLASNARPDQILNLARAAKLKTIPTGIEHGTITVISEGTPYEITTFRQDIETDGRRATIQYADSLKSDATRRDFTMNALYADASGKIYDPLNGLADLKAGHLRFIENAERRITEDYLRILRFFRFSAWYADPDLGFDPDALAAIATQGDGLLGLSKERITKELLKLLAAPSPAPAVAAMRITGVLQHVLPGSDDKALAPLVYFESLYEAPIDPLRRLAALGGGQVEAHLRLSKAQSKTLKLLKTHIEAITEAGELAYRCNAPIALDVLLLRAALFETPVSEPDLRAVQTGASAQFPITAEDLMPLYTGSALGKKLRALEQIWITSGFRLDKTELLRTLDAK